MTTKTLMNSSGNMQRVFAITYSDGYTVIHVNDTNATRADVGKLYPSAVTIRFMDEVRLVNIETTRVPGEGEEMTTVITPVPIITSRPREPERCPNCGHEEGTATVCRHCKYEYPANHDTSMDFIIGFVIFATVVVALCWLSIVFSDWALLAHDETLLECFAKHTNDILSLFGRIY